MRSWLLLVALASGCAHYGWADRAGPTLVDRPVAVRTIDIDAHAGADGADLTREFVTELQRLGVRQATWTGAGERDVVQCDIALIEDVGFGEHAFVSVSTRCLVDEKVVSTRMADAQLALPSSDRRLGRRRAAESAARATLSAVASDVAAYLRE